jgi:hypothetical protein
VKFKIGKEKERKKKINKVKSICQSKDLNFEKKERKNKIEIKKKKKKEKK